MRTILLAVVCVAIAGPAAAASFIGEQFSAGYYYPSASDLYASASFSPPVFTVGNGTETIGDVEGVTNIDVDFAATTLTLSLSTTLSNPTWNGTSFNGPIFMSASAIGFTQVALGAGTNLAGFDLSRVTFTGHEIGINWNGLTYTNGSTVELIFSGQVPEPASWAMMLTGFGAIGAARRIRRRSLSFG